MAFDDSQWFVGKAANLNVTELGPLYIRKTFTIPNLDDYQVLNVRAFFLDGLAVYFNGKLVALFNMPSPFDSATPPFRRTTAGLLSFSTSFSITTERSPDGT